MYINVKDKKSLNRFYRLLPFYRTFLFRFTKFKIKEDKYNISSIIEALNIKNRMKRLEYIYDTACNEIDLYYKGLNICGFKNGRCKSQLLSKTKNVNGCCGLCVYVTDKGCPTRNVSCKLFVCDIVKKKYKPIKFKDIKILKLLSIRQKLIITTDCLSTREQAINDLYTGLLIVGYSRMFFRLIINTIILVRRKKHEEKRKK